jgi:hypothetical protein
VVLLFLHPHSQSQALEPGRCAEGCDLILSLLFPTFPSTFCASLLPFIYPLCSKEEQTRLGANGIFPFLKRHSLVDLTLSFTLPSQYNIILLFQNVAAQARNKGGPQPIFCGPYTGLARLGFRVRPSPAFPSGCSISALSWHASSVHRPWLPARFAF